MKVVCDTSSLLSVVLNEPERSFMIELTQGHELISPEVLPFEVGNALSAMVRKSKLEPDFLRIIWNSVSQIEIELCSVDFPRALDIVSQFSIYAYDAYFLEVAERHRCPLLTLDRQMKRIARKLQIGVLEQI